MRPEERRVSQLRRFTFFPDLLPGLSDSETCRMRVVYRHLTRLARFAVNIGDIYLKREYEIDMETLESLDAANHHPMNGQFRVGVTEMLDLRHRSRRSRGIKALKVSEVGSIAGIRIGCKQHE